MKLAKHFLITESGDLYDTRKTGWHKLPPLRAGYTCHKNQLDSVGDIKAALRAGHYTGLGGYPLYFITSDGAALSFESVLQNFRSVADSVKKRINDGWRVVGLDINYEDADLICDHSGKKIGAAYAD